MNETAIILVSGGLDSCVTAAIANSKHNTVFLHVNYGNKTENREKKAFNDIAGFYNVKDRLVVNIDYLQKIGGTSLIDSDKTVPNSDLNRKEIPPTYVPFRNTHLIAIAVSWAEVIGASYVYIGAVEEDSSGYPDCRKSYFEAYNKLIDEGTKPDTKIEIITPIIDLNKTEIIKIGNELNAPFHLTWSCYKNEDIACGKCDSCVLRLRGFKKANIRDPLKYKMIPPEYV